MRLMCIICTIWMKRAFLSAYLIKAKESIPNRKQFEADFLALVKTVIESGLQQLQASALTERASLQALFIKLFLATSRTPGFKILTLNSTGPFSHLPQRVGRMMRWDSHGLLLSLM